MIYVVVGVADTGSGSLTWPEDFDVVGYAQTEARAQALADEMNKKSRDAVDPDDPEADEEEYDGLVYEVLELYEI